MTEKEKIAIIYHNIFNYPLNKEELKRWSAGPQLTLKNASVKYIPLPSKKDRISQKSINNRKLELAKNAAKIMSKVPTVLFVGVTGSLAMNNAKAESDIDLMVITKRNSLWVTRLFVYFLLRYNKVSIRKPRESDEKDRICLNFWIDESAFLWDGPKNCYIAHEIAQVVPLWDRQDTYAQWTSKNKWINNYWPNAMGSRKNIVVIKEEKDTLFLSCLQKINTILFLMQSLYMAKKRTRETISINKAYFHPYDWGKKVLLLLKKAQITEV